MSTLSIVGGEERGISIVVVRDLPKVEAPVRSWYPAQKTKFFERGMNRDCEAISGSVPALDEITA